VLALLPKGGNTFFSRKWLDSSLGGLNGHKALSYNNLSTSLSIKKNLFLLVVLVIIKL